MMRKSVILAGSSAIAVLMAASAAGATGPASYGGAAAVSWGPGTPAAQDYPPNAQPGQCFAKVLVPEQTESFTEQVLVSPRRLSPM